MSDYMRRVVMCLILAFCGWGLKEIGQPFWALMPLVASVCLAWNLLMDTAKGNY